METGIFKDIGEKTTTPKQNPDTVIRFSEMKLEPQGKTRDELGIKSEIAFFLLV